MAMMGHEWVMDDIPFPQALYISFLDFEALTRLFSRYLSQCRLCDVAI